MIKTIIDINSYKFDETLLSKIVDEHYIKDLWPLVYILSDEDIKELYVGETTDATSRLKNHLRNKEKNYLTSAQILTCDKFNKSATLDIESNLIKYLSGDGYYRLLNGNLGLANHTYYQKYNIYWDIFKTIWSKLITKGIAKKTLGEIDNSDLFKYSPYKSLSSDQMLRVLDIIKALCTDHINSIVIEGGAGTGKSILAIYLFKLLNSKENDFEPKEFNETEVDFLNILRQLKEKYPSPRMALVVPMDSFRATLKKAFKNIKGLTASMVIGPAEVTRNKYDIIVVDESHRLRKRVNLGTYFGAFDIANKRLNLDKNTGTELDWVIKQGDKIILFYDENQSIKPSDVNRADFNKLKNKPGSIVKKLTSQFRVKGGIDYISYIDNLLNCQFKKSNTIYFSKEYEFLLFDSLGEMIQRIKKKNNQIGLARIIAGFSWKWVSKNDPNLHDIVIGDIKLRWNSVTKDFINSPNSINEVGCIHTTQGYDLNYTGVIFGNEISYDKKKNEIFIKKEEYYDRNGKQGITDPLKLKEYIINIYKTILLRGIKGTYIYVCDKDLREYFKEHILLSEVEVKKLETIKVNELSKSPYVDIKMMMVPLVGSAPCGSPLISEENIDEIIMVDKNKIKSGYKYFILKVQGDSMNMVGINDKDLVLCKYGIKPETGDRVVALLGGENVTIKYYDKKNGRRILLPKSSNPKHKPIIPKEGDIVQGVIQEVIKREI